MPVNIYACHTAQLCPTACPHIDLVLLYISVNRKPIGFEFSSIMHMYNAFDNHIYSFSSMILMYYMYSRHISFSLFIPITFEIVHTFVSIQNANTHDMLCYNHKYFTFLSHILSFTSIIPLIFLIWQSYLFYCHELFTAIHKCLTVGSHICLFRSMTTYVFLIWQAYFPFPCFD